MNYIKFAVTFITELLYRSILFVFEIPNVIFSFLSFVYSLLIELPIMFVIEIIITLEFDLPIQLIKAKFHMIKTRFINDISVLFWLTENTEEVDKELQKIERKIKELEEGYERENKKDNKNNN